MSDLLTARDVQELLNVDRTTVYRMAKSGKLPAVRVGNQWRFPRKALEAWLARQGIFDVTPVKRPTPVAAQYPYALFPQDCLQYVLDTFAEMLGVMLLLVDMEGRFITRPSNPCGLYTVLGAYPRVHERCIEQWMFMARQPALQPEYMVSPLGFLCARALVQTEGEPVGMVIAAGIAPDMWPPDDGTVSQIAAELGVPADVYRQHVHAVYTLSREEKQRVLHFLQRIADVVSHIVAERRGLLERLQKIQELARLP